MLLEVPARPDPDVRAKPSPNTTSAVDGLRSDSGIPLASLEIDLQSVVSGVEVDALETIENLTAEVSEERPLRVEP